MARPKQPARTPESELPLRPATFQVLLALADGERHGYAIMKEVAERSDNSVRLGPGTLYGTLKRLLQGGLVEESDERAVEDGGDERRRYYRLSRFGLSVARAEARRMDGLVRAARQSMLLATESA